MNETKAQAETSTTPPTIEAFGVTYGIETIAARLRAELNAEAEQLRCAGEEEGRRWAAEEASFEELNRLEDLRAVTDVAFHELSKQFDVAHVIEEEDARALRASKTLSCAFADGFIAGALHVWDLVHPSVE